MSGEKEWLLEQALRLYDVVPDCEITMGGTSSRIFEVKKGQTSYILRAAEHSPESEEHTAFELDWVAYLSRRMDGIVRPERSNRGALYEVVGDEGKAYILSLLEKAPGKLVDPQNPEEFSEPLFFNLGALMGEMHRLTAAYVGATRKPALEWTGASWRKNNVIFDENVRHQLKKYRDEIRMLPIDKDSYGIVHYDIHIDNFFVEGGNIKLFDFGACQFNWYAADIASALFFMVLKGAGPLTRKSEKERTEFAEACLIAYLKGYLQNNRLTKYWICKIDLFMKFQMGDEYLAVQSFWPEELADVRDWYMEWHRERITKGLPYVLIDYDKVIDRLSAIEE